MRSEPLTVTHPELAAQAHGWDPSTRTAGSDKKLSWQCAAGHVWEATVGNRVAGTGCPYCSGRKVLKGLNDLATTHPELAAQVIEGDPTKVSAGSHRKLRWLCDEGHEWQGSISDRAKPGGTRCPICSGQRVHSGFNDLATTHPELAAQARDWDPTTVNAGSNKKRWWRCKQGHEWEATPNTRSRGRGCPYCSGNRVLAGFNDLATTHPELAAQALGWEPTRVSAGSNVKARWQCEEGHEWQAAVKNRIRGRGCPVCSNREALAGYNDLATRYPELAKQALGWDPTTVPAGSSRKLAWRCERGHQWEAVVASRVDGRGCPFCVGQRVQAGFNDLATAHPDLAAQAFGWDPTAVSSASGRKLRWKCAEGHEWIASVGDRATGTGCPYCTGRRVLAGFNDLATTHPALATQALGWDPTTKSAGHEQKVLWRCPEGHEWEATINNRTNQGSGCPSCASYGFDPTLPGWLYLLSHPVLGLEAARIGADLGVHWKSAALRAGRP